MDVDVIAGLDMMIQRGQWDKAIETAEQQVAKQFFPGIKVILGLYSRSEWVGTQL